MSRIILHVDMDSFYASVEELRNPEIRGKAIVTCMFSGRTEDSGAVSAANYKARELGIHSGMPIRVAKRLAKGKDVIFLPSDREYYWSVSEKVMNILRKEADAFEQVSVDEAYLDVSKKAKGSWERAQKIAESIKREIKEKEGLTCSIGIGPNKLVAKMASKKQKPDGLTLVKDTEVKRFFGALPASKLFGVGPKTARELEGLGIKTAKELAHFDLKILEEKFGNNRARDLRETALGMDESPVEERQAQQISRMATLPKDSDSPDEIFQKIQELAKDIEEELKESKLNYKTISIIGIDTHLQMRTRSRTTIDSASLEKNLDIAKELIESYLEENPGKLRRIGIRVSGLSRKGKPEMKAQRTLGEF